MHNIALRLDPDRIVVYASTWKRGQEGAEATARFDAEQPYRSSGTGRRALPTPRVTRRATALLGARCTSVWFGARPPLGLMAPALRAAGARRLVATTQATRRPGRSCRPHGGCCGGSAGPRTPSPISVSTPAPVSPPRSTPGTPPGWCNCRRGGREDLHPGSGGDGIRARLGLAERPVVVCVSRLVPRKGQDTLIQAMPRILKRVPDAVLLIVGGGPYAKDLSRLAETEGVADSVRFTGPVPWEELPAHYGAGDVFAMPCRTRRGGLDVEGLGIVYLEASATGLPVVAGDSGGAPDAVLDGETGGSSGAAPPSRAPIASWPCWRTPNCAAAWASGGAPGWRSAGAGICWPTA
ncbi:Glycosyl transferase family 1 OS=Streptomyces antimycoticus OX=68175 GN=SSPO_071170 PE=4 SV=1 [Streptomyces antimycoticus]